MYETPLETACRISCPKAPEWYAALYFEHLRNVENLTEEAVYAWARRKSRETNINIVVPPPHRGSPRFLQVAYLLDFTIDKLLTFIFPIKKYSTMFRHSMNFNPRNALG